MAQRSPIVLNATSNGYLPLQSGDTITVASIPLSATAGNSITANPDGLYSSGADPATIAAVFKDCAGNDQVPNAQIPTCAEMNAAITGATSGLIHLASAVFDDTTQILTLTMSDSTTIYTVDLSELKTVSVDPAGGLAGDGTTAAPLKLNVVTATVAAASTGTDMPLAIQGTRDVLMGGPAGYMAISATQAVPYYAIAP